MSVQEQLDIVTEKIEEAKKRSPYDEDVTLMAVTKTVSCDRIIEALEYGITDIGENKVQELETKYEILKDYAPRFHMIGSLQSNKVKDVMDKAVLIHSLDRKSLLKESEKRGKRRGRPINYLIQLNISKESTKSGVYVEDLEDFIKQIEEKEFVKVKGLMTMAPHYEDPEKTRPVFRKAREIYDNLKQRDFKNIEMKYLSMGMSNDFEIAVEEGSNMVRVGSMIFGERDYK